MQIFEKCFLEKDFTTYYIPQFTWLCKVIVKYNVQLKANTKLKSFSC